MRSEGKSGSLRDEDKSGMNQQIYRMTTTRNKQEERAGSAPLLRVDRIVTRGLLSNTLSFTWALGASE
jgi:hypothetical protein